MKMKKSTRTLFIFGVIAIIAGIVLTVVTTNPIIGIVVVGIYLLSSIVKLVLEYKEKEKASLEHRDISRNVSTLNKKVDEILEGVTMILTTIPEDLSEHTELSNEQRQRILKASKQIQDISHISAPLTQIETYYRLGNFFLIEKEFEKSIELFNKVISMNPNHIKSRYNKARALQEMGRTSEALQEMGTAKMLSPDSSDEASALINLACTFTAMGRYSDALETYERAIELHPNQPWAYYSAAEIAEKLGDYDKALIYWNRFLLLAKTEPEYASKISEVVEKIEHIKNAGGA